MDDAAPARKKINLYPILLESGFILLGVLLALAANNWNEGRKQRAHAAAALNSMVKEVESNRNLVLQSLEYHLYLSDTLAKFRRQPGAGGRYPDMRVFHRGFIRPAEVIQTAWQSANATDALSHIDYNAVLQLSNIYLKQQYYDEQAKQIGESIYAAVFTKGMAGVVENYENLSYLIGTMLYTECRLLDEYGSALAALASTAADSLATPEFCGVMRGR